MLLTLDIGSTARYRGPGHIHIHTRHDLRTGYPVLGKEIGRDISNTRTVLVSARVPKVNFRKAVGVNKYSTLPLNGLKPLSSRS